MSHKCCAPLGPGEESRFKMNSRELKEKHETWIGNQLLNALKLDGRLIRHGKDGREPDLIYSVGGTTVGVEVSAAYLGEGAARVDWDLARGKAQRGILDLYKGDERMLSSMQRVLDEKCLNTYSGADEVWLCIEARDPLPLVWQMEELIKSLSLPYHKYQRIYVGFRALPYDGGGFRVFKLPREPETS